MIYFDIPYEQAAPYIRAVAVASCTGGLIAILNVLRTGARKGFDIVDNIAVIVFGFLMPPLVVITLIFIILTAGYAVTGALL